MSQLKSESGSVSAVDRPAVTHRSVRDALPLIGTGVAFALTVNLPPLFTEPDAVGLVPLVASVLVGLTFLVGAALMGAVPRARVLALVVFPLVIAGGFGWSGAMTPSPTAALLIVATWWIYLAVTLTWGAAGATADMVSTPIAERPAPTPWRVRSARNVYFLVMILGGLALVVVAPTLGGDAAYRAAFGDEADAAWILVGAVGATLGVSIVVGILGAGLRRRSKTSLPTRRTTWIRASIYVAIAAAIAVALYFLPE